MSDVERAAVVVQLTDGTRMLYEFKPDRPIALSTDNEWAHYYSNVTTPPLLVATHLTVEGELLGGAIWDGDMPTTQYAELHPTGTEIKA